MPAGGPPKPRSDFDRADALDDGAAYPPWNPGAASPEAGRPAGAAFLHRLLASSGDCIKGLDLDGRLEFMSAGGLRAMEIDDFGPYCGRPWLAFWTGPPAAAAGKALAEARAGRTARFEGEAVTAKGTLKVWDVVVTAIPGPGGAPERLLAISRDVTAQRRTEAALRASEARLAGLVRQAAVGIAQIDPGGRFVLVNDRYVDLLGRPREEVLGRTVGELTFPDDLPATQALFHRLLATGEPFAIEKRYLRPDGSTVWVSNHVSLTRDPTGDPQSVIAVSQDVTGRKQAEAEAEALLEEVRRLALQDGLTGLPNRTLLLDRLEQAIARARREGKAVAVMLLDLDGFKAVNDALGHPAGDRLLQQVAGRLAPLLRADDTLARLGGDEFVLVQPRVRRPADAEAIATKLLAALAGAFELDGQRVHVGASIGIALFPRDGVDTATLLRRADLALYRAKAEGRAQFRFFAPAMDAAARERHDLTHELRNAIGGGELVLHYQLQLDLESGRYAGAEALVRWRHPKRGLLMPGAFVPLAEASGLIRPLGEWVLGEACRQAAAWRAAGLALTVAVNISPVELRGQGAPPRIGQALRQAGLPHGGLELELTEAVLMETLGGEADGFLHRLAARGVSLAIDDFGVGYSSLAYLRRLPAQKIKIDRSFVGAVGLDQGGEELLRSIVALGHSLRKRVVAEGVETPLQLAFLRAAGCDEVQGFHIAPPLPASDVERLLTDGGYRLATASRPAAEPGKAVAWGQRSAAPRTASGGDGPTPPATGPAEPPARDFAALLRDLDRVRATVAETCRRAAHEREQNRLAQEQAAATCSEARQLIRQVREHHPRWPLGPNRKRAV